MNYKVKFPGRLISKSNGGHSRIYLDQLSDDEVWIYSRNMGGYLSYTYGLTCSEYYSLVVYGDKDYKGKCIKCGGPTNFQSLSRGWTEFCCRSHQTSVSCTNQHNDPDSPLSVALNKLYASTEFIEFQRSRFSQMNKENWANEEYRKAMSDKSFSTINSWQSKCKSKCHTFKSQGNSSDLCRFYIGYMPDYTVKFGVTSKPLTGFCYARMNRVGMITIHKLLEGSRYMIADLELYVKLNLGSDNEYVENTKIHEVITLVRQFIEAQRLSHKGVESSDSK